MPKTWDSRAMRHHLRSEPIQVGWSKEAVREMSRYHVFSDRVTWHKSMGTALKKVSGKALTAAKKEVFGRSGKFNITQKKAQAHGRFGARTRYEQMGDLTAATINMRGERISLVHFKVGRPRWVRSRIGRRKAIRVKILRGGSPKIPKERIGGGNIAQRYDPSRGEFTGFLGRGRAGKMDGAGAELIFQRVNKPRGRRGKTRKEDRLPLQKMTALEPSRMMMQDAGLRAVDKVVKTDFDRIFFGRLDYYSKQAARKRK